MAFNFNWSPLTADASFYIRAQDLLTTALNKSPKPPIIVDDILVNELNLGSVPPDLEILEIGDLAEDRFRGIFKMGYSGDAFLTLKTRVQVNPLNTYLSTRPSFASPEPLAAASGLTIPLKITLSDIRLSAFIILVFSKQKGITLVFRNDPLESLKVSSTFDSIPFVRDYLQKEIEGQLRTLLINEVPAIIHRLSLRLWVPEYRIRDNEELRAKENDKSTQEVTKDPLASPPQDPVDFSGNTLDAAQIAALSLDSSAETQSLFSQKNLLRLATLRDSNRTLSLFTPSLKDVVFRAWTGPMERGDATGAQSPVEYSLSRKHSHIAPYGAPSILSASSEAGSHSTKPPLSIHSTSFPGSSKHNKLGRRRKHRIVDLRKKANQLDDLASVSDGSTMSGTLSSGAVEHEISRSVPEEKEIELATPSVSPRPSIQVQKSPETVDHSSPSTFDKTPRRAPYSEKQNPREGLFQRTGSGEPAESSSVSNVPPRRRTPNNYFHSFQVPGEKLKHTTTEPLPPSVRPGSPFLAAPFPYVESSPGGILEQAWMMRMAGEIARRVQEQKTSGSSFWDASQEQEAPPPAYAS